MAANASTTMTESAATYTDLFKKTPSLLSRLLRILTRWPKTLANHLSTAGGVRGCLRTGGGAIWLDNHAVGCYVGTVGLPRIRLLGGSTPPRVTRLCPGLVPL